MKQPKTVIHLETVQREDGNAVTYIEGSLQSLSILICAAMVADKSFERAVLIATAMYIKIQESGRSMEEFLKTKREMTEEEFNAS